MDVNAMRVRTKLVVTFHWAREHIRTIAQLSGQGLAGLP